MFLSSRVAIQKGEAGTLSLSQEKVTLNIKQQLKQLNYEEEIYSWRNYPTSKLIFWALLQVPGNLIVLYLVCFTHIIVVTRLFVLKIFSKKDGT